jgi:methyl-accepting chemotaxis protein
MNAIAGSIAAAVEQQGAATAEIARNVSETARAANEMTGRTGEVSNEARETGRRAEAVLQNTGALTAAVDDLKHSVIRVVRTSTAEVDRREALRYAIDLPCRIVVGGKTHQARLVDLSDGGAHIRDAPALTVGARGTLAIDGVQMPLPFVSHEHVAGMLHVAFTLDAAATAAMQGTAERLSRKIAA